MNNIVGDVINFRGTIYAPVNEQGVVLLFGRIMNDLNMYVESIQSAFPDCYARRYTGKGWEGVHIEFEFKSSNFKLHNHDEHYCDMIVCWEHDWKDCPLEVIELKSKILELENEPIQRPSLKNNTAANEEDAIEQIFKNNQTQTMIIGLFGEIVKKIKEFDPEIWLQIGTKYIGVFSPEKSFASILIRKKSISIECYSKGEVLAGTKISNSISSPMWITFSVKTKADIEKAVNILSFSYQKIKTAIKNGETTGYFAGGYSSSEACEHANTILESQNDHETSES